MKKINPFLWFDEIAEEAVNFYTSLFNNSKIGKAVRYDEVGAKASGQKAGSVMTVPFTLAGQDFTAINGGPHFKINPSISFFVHSMDEKEIDNLWEKFSDGGKVLMELDKYDWSKKYGWVEDKFGLSWQLMVTENEVEQKIIPSLLFVGNVYGRAEEAINFYTSIFNNAKVKSVFKFDNDNAVMYSDFVLEGNIFSAMDGPGEHNFNFNEAISFVVSCDDQKEIDYFWDKLSTDPQAEMCGWLKDKFGISWQIVPKILPELLKTNSKKVMEEVLKMKKLDIASLQKAADKN